MTNRDSIKSKIFEEGGGVVWGGREKLSLESFSPSNIHTLNNDTDPT